MSAMTSLSLFIAPIGFGQAVSGVLFFEQHLPLVLGDESAVFVVVESGDALVVGCWLAAWTRLPSSRISKRFPGLCRRRRGRGCGLSVPIYRV